MHSNNPSSKLHSFIDSALRQADEHEEKNDYEGVLRWLTNAADAAKRISSPSLVNILIRRSRTYLRHNDTYNAYKDCNAAELLNPENVDVINLRQSIEEFGKQYFVGMKLREYVTGSSDHNAQYHEKLTVFALEILYDASRLYDKKEYEKAILKLNEAMSILPLDLGLIYRGKCYYNLNQFDLALQDFDAAINIKSSALVYLSKGLAENKRKNYRVAKQNLAKGMALDDLGMTHPEDVIRIVEQLIRCEIALACEDKIKKGEDFTPAEQKIFEHAMLTANNSLNSELYYRRGQESLKNMNYEQAIEDFHIGLWLKQVNICHSDFSDLNFYPVLRLSYIALGDYQKAMQQQAVLINNLKYVNIINVIKSNVEWLDSQFPLSRMTIKKHFADKTFYDYARNLCVLTFIKELINKAECEHQNQSAEEAIKCYYYIIYLNKEHPDLSTSNLANYITKIINTPCAMQNFLSQLSSPMMMIHIQHLVTVIQQLNLFRNNRYSNHQLEEAIASCEKDMFSFINTITNLFSSKTEVHEPSYLTQQILLAKKLEVEAVSINDNSKFTDVLKIIEEIVPSAEKQKHHLLFAAYILQGKCQAALKQFDKALISFLKADAMQATVTTSFYVGLIHGELNHASEAKDFLVKYMSLDQTNVLENEYKNLVQIWNKCEKAIDKRILSALGNKKTDLLEIEYALSSFANGSREEKQNNEMIYTDPDLYFKRATRYKTNENYKSSLKDLVIGYWFLKRQNGKGLRLVQFLLEKIDVYFKLGLIKLANPEFIELFKIISGLNKSEILSIPGVDGKKICVRMGYKLTDDKVAEHVNNYLLLTFAERCQFQAKQYVKNGHLQLAIDYYVTAILSLDNILPDILKNYNKTILNFIFIDNNNSRYAMQNSSEVTLQKLGELKNILKTLLDSFVVETRAVTEDESKNKNSSSQANLNDTKHKPAQKISLHSDKTPKQITLSKVLKELKAQKAKEETEAKRLLDEQERVEKIALQQRLKEQSDLKNQNKQQKILAKKLAAKNEKLKTKEKLKQVREAKEAETKKLEAEKEAQFLQQQLLFSEYKNKANMLLEQARYGLPKNIVKVISQVKDFDDEKLPTTTVAVYAAEAELPKIEDSMVNQLSESKVELNEIPELKQFLIPEEKNKVQNLPYYKYIKRITKLQREQDNNCPLTFIVGGLLRNYQLDKKMLPTDIDIVTDATNEQIRLAFADAKQVNMYSDKAGDIYVIKFLDGASIEVFRSKVLVETVGTPAERIQADALARDLTINALYADEWGNLYAPLSESLNDIENLNLRMIKDIIESFSENPIRMLRVIILMSQLNLNIHDQKYMNIANAIRLCAPLLMQKELPFKINGQINKLSSTGSLLSNINTLISLGVFDVLFSFMSGSTINLASDSIIKNSHWLTQNFMDIDNRTVDGKTNSINKIYMMIIVAMAGNSIDPQVLQNNISEIINNNSLFATNFAKYDYLGFLQQNIVSNYLDYWNGILKNMFTQPATQIGPDPLVTQFHGMFFNPHFVPQQTENVQPEGQSNNYLQVNM